jgi:hypothetical protein
MKITTLSKIALLWLSLISTVLNVHLHDPKKPEAGSGQIAKLSGDATFTDSVKDIFNFSHYIAHTLAYDTTKTDSFVNPLSKATVVVLLNPVEIKSKKMDGIDYEGRALVGKSKTNPNVLIIAFRGTDNKCNGIEDARIAKTKLTSKSYKSYKDAKVHEGFNNVYRSLRDELRITVQTALKGDKNINTILITGHSLGGALANLCAVDMDHYYNRGDGKKIYPDGYKFNLVTFGAPRVGDQKFADYVNKIPKLYRNVRVVYDMDLVSQIPFTPDYVHAGTLAKFDPSAGKFTLGKFNVDDSPRFEVANSIIDSNGLTSYVVNLIDLIDCKDSAWDAIKKIANKLPQGTSWQVFKTGFKILTDTDASDSVKKISNMGANHSMYSKDIIPGHMAALNDAYEKLAGSSGRAQKRRSLRKK